MDTICVPAAQYVRMSTDDQQYSIDNQKAAISKFAERHGLSIVRTYSDAGRTGVVLRHRPALTQLLKDVLSEETPFKAVLVYDVSRWGRFQDPDESAHYEFLCRRAGIAVHYCAEPFVNDGTPATSILKALKRSMAAEYSRELGVKVFEGKCRIVRLGFRVGSAPGFGFRRMLVSANGNRKLILKDGECKSVKTDRVVLVLGPMREVRQVQEIYEMYLRRKMTMKAIGRELNSRHVPFLPSREWNSACVKSILTSPKYCGDNVWGRKSNKLQGPTVYNPKEDWAVRESAFPAIIDPAIFERVQNEIQARRSGTPNAVLLAKLRRLFKSKGKLTSRIITAGKGVPCCSTYSRRFGSLQKAYETVGYHHSASAFLKAAHNEFRLKLLQELVRDLVRLFPDHVRPGNTLLSSGPPTIIVDGDELPLITCRALKGKRGTSWLLVARRLFFRYKPVLLCFVSERYERFERLYLIPALGNGINKFKCFKRDDSFFVNSEQVIALGNFYSHVKRIRRSRARVKPQVTIFDDAVD